VPGGVRYAVAIKLTSITILLISWVEKQEEAETKKSSAKRRPACTKKTKQQQEEDRLIDHALDRAGIGRSNDNPISIDDAGASAASCRSESNLSGFSGSGSKEQHLAELTSCFKQIADMGSKYFMASMMGITQDNAASYLSEDQKREFVAAQSCMHLAELEKNILDLEESNKRHRMNLRETSDSNNESLEAKNRSPEQGTTNNGDGTSATMQGTADKANPAAENEVHDNIANDTE